MENEIKSAIFVDFDNIFISLTKIGKLEAECFAREPGRWLDWIVRGMPDGAENNSHMRRMLIQRCYLNPHSFSDYRQSFVREGFVVIDCPPLTGRGKTSTDIHMVIDLLDALRQFSHLDEFILFSADADFTPVFQRIRAHNKNTVALAIGPVSRAYTAVCDHVIDSDIFIEVSREEKEKPMISRLSVYGEYDEFSMEDAISKRELMSNIADIFHNTIVESESGELRPDEVPSLLRRDFSEHFTRDSNWLGCFGLRPMVEKIVENHVKGALKIEEEEDGHWVVLSEAEPLHIPEEKSEESYEYIDQLRAQIAENITRIVADSERPVRMEIAAHGVAEHLGESVISTRWAGHGSFKNFVRRNAGSTQVDFHILGTGAYIYDRSRHVLPSTDSQVSRLEDLPEEVKHFARFIDKFVSIPRLQPDDYRSLFEHIAEYVNTHEFSLSEASRDIRDNLSENKIPRKAVSYVLKNLIFGGLEFGLEQEHKHTAYSLALKYRDNLIHQLGNVGCTLDEEQQRLLAEWVGVDARARDVYGDTLLHTAAWGNDRAAVVELLERGAEVDARNNNDQTPLHSAVRKDAAEVTAELLEGGADIQARDGYGNTPLHLAAWRNARNSVSELLEREADVEARDNRDQTPLHCAVQRDATDAVAALVEGGADITRKGQLRKYTAALWRMEQCSAGRCEFAEAWR